MYSKIHRSTYQQRADAGKNTSTLLLHCKSEWTQQKIDLPNWWPALSQLNHQKIPNSVYLRCQQLQTGCQNDSAPPHQNKFKRTIKKILWWVGKTLWGAFQVQNQRNTYTVHLRVVQTSSYHQ